MPPLARTFWVYILSSRSRNLYTGVTNDLVRRVKQHKDKAADGFPAQYNIDRLVYMEEHTSALAAIGREKQIKGWDRSKRVALIETSNPAWDDLSEAWYEAKAASVTGRGQEQVPPSSG